MPSPSRLAQSWPILAGAVAGFLAFAVASMVRPGASDTEQRLDAMQAEIHTLRAEIEAVNVQASYAAGIADELRFDLQHSPGSVIGGR